jgi:hypothetical protein
MSQLYPAAPMEAPPRPAPGPAPGAGAELDIMARLTVCLDGLTTAARQLAAARDRARLSWEECHLIDIPPAQSTAAGTIDPPDIWQPRAGWVWNILLLAGTLGASGTGMSVYRDAAVPTNLLLGPVTSGLWEPKGLFLMPGRRLVWTSAGDALTVSTGIAVEIAIDKLPAYLL